MKKLLTLTLVIIMAASIHAQDNSEELYLIFEFMKVNDEQGSNYLEVEEFWSGIHKQRVADKKIIGWDLWSLTPSGSEQGSQYLTVTLYSSLQDMMAPISMDDILASAKKAYPDNSDEDFSAMMNKTMASRDLAHQVYLKQIDATEGDFEMKVGTMATIDVMKQLNNNYVKAESEIFKPFHQQMVNDGQKGSWGLVRVILPAGTDAYATHMTVNMYKDVAQLTAAMEGGPGDSDGLTQLAVKEGLETRDMREVKIATLEMMVR
ncbi:MAG: hypothetical protein KAQ79_07680 [Cyclobacteriaceae bacterium]|nr:hypothetical protein [Cyclobacteriaceae bacterium]